MYILSTDLLRSIEINKYNEQNIPVFLAAGNKPGKFKFESLLPGTVTVGALEHKPKKNWKLKHAYYSSDTDLVNQWEQGTYPVRVIRNPKGEIKGYNITDGKTVDIPVEQTSAKGKDIKTITVKWGASGKTYELVENVLVTEGTSWAAPTAAGKYLRKKFGNACDLTKTTKQ